MSKEQLTHIFEPSACLSPRQLKGYATGKMVHEECHAVEVHLLSCPFCSDALEGVIALKDAGAIAGMEKLDDSFIAKQLGVPAQEIKQVTKSKPVIKAGAYSSNPDTKEKKAVRIPWKPLSLAASLVVAVCIMWFMRDSIFPQQSNDELAEQQAVIPPAPEPEVVYRPVEDTNAIAMVDTMVTVQEELMEQEAMVADVKDLTTEKTHIATKDSAGLAASKALAKKEAEKKQADAKLAAAKKLADENAKLAMNTPKDKAVLPSNTEERSRMGNSYDAKTASDVATKVKETKKEEPVAETEPVKKKIELGTARSGILKGDEAFNDGKYKKALKLYQKVMYDPESNQKDAATLMAAKCHIAMEEMMQARTLLNSLINENSTKKGEASGLLNEVKE